MNLRYIGRRALPYEIPDDLPARPKYNIYSPRPNLVSRMLLLETRDSGNGIAGGYIALIVILALVLLANAAAFSVWLHRRRAKQQAAITRSITYPQEKVQMRRSWRPKSDEWFGKKPAGEGDEIEELIQGYHRKQPSIKISRPMSKDANIGPTPIFSTNGRESLHSIGIMELPANSPETTYDSDDASRSHSRLGSNESQFHSPAGSRSTSPAIQKTRSRANSVSSNRSKSYSQSPSPRPLAQNSYFYARTRSCSNGSASRLPLTSAPALPEEDEESNTPTKPLASTTVAQSRSTSSSLRPSPRGREKSLPPVPSLPSSEIISARPTISHCVSSPAILSKPTPIPQFDFQEFDNLIESTQVINIAISEPLDIPQGPFSPHGRTKAQLDAARGVGSGWYTSPSSSYIARREGSWLV